METKSRYEVISDLESQKRNLIQQRDGLNNELKNKEKEIVLTERNKTDQVQAWDRKIADLKEDRQNFEDSMSEQKETIIELIKSVDASLERFSSANKK